MPGRRFISASQHVRVAKPFSSSLRALASAPAMVSPVTNCSPIRRIAVHMPLRISGSPLLLIMRSSERDRLASLWVDTSLPVNSKPAAALTN